MEMLTKKIEDKKALLQRIAEHGNAIKSFGVRELRIFGSFVRNEMDENSDIDFLVEFYPEQKTYNNFIGLAHFLEDLCGRKIELVTNKGLSRYIDPKILNTTEFVAFTS